MATRKYNKKRNKKTIKLINQKPRNQKLINQKPRNQKLIKRGGKTISSDTPVKLNYKDKEIVCDVCGGKHYTENTGSFNKSKLRSGVGQIFLGEAAEILDTTSVIIYTCNTCGLCKIIRNKEPLLITSQPV